MENVSVHAQGLGYLMMDLDPLPDAGLSIYVGDTGIGLSKGIRAAYEFRPRNDAEAVGMILRMRSHLRLRRRAHGPFISGGRGLERVGTILAKLKGKLLVRSGSAMAEFEPSSSLEPARILEKLYPIQGTQLHIFIPTKPSAARHEPRTATGHN